jgi:hypothetical protein
VCDRFAGHVRLNRVVEHQEVARCNSEAFTAPTRRVVPRSHSRFHALQGESPDSILKRVVPPRALCSRQCGALALDVFGEPIAMLKSHQEYTNAS